MRLLLDTHVFLWLQTEPERLGPHLDLVRDTDTELAISAVSGWEITIKYALGRLPLPEPPPQYVPARAHAIGARVLSIDLAHALAVGGLPLIHRDPFDRLLVAQAACEGLTILTADRIVAAYAEATQLIGSAATEA